MLDDGTPGALGPTVLAALSRAPAHPPGEYDYSNLGYMTVGYALERLTGKPWQQQMKEELFLPLQMTSCGFGPPSGADEVAQPWGHAGRRRSTPELRSDNPPALGPAGTVHCSMEDWGRFLALHLRGARGEPTALLGAETLKRLQTPPSSGTYAAGWLVEAPSWAGGPALTHEGSNTYWYATVWIVPEKDTVFVAVANAANPATVTALSEALSLLVERYVL
jgi:CubicO group peptidase (beta-lactamase class C family)